MNRLHVSMLILCAALLAAALAVEAGSGGPDSKGYRWVDGADGPGLVYGTAPAASIAGPATQIFPERDQDAAAIPLSPPFIYYGTAYNQVFVNNNGFISFQGAPCGAPPCSTSVPHSLPDATQLPANFIAGCWGSYLGDAVTSSPSNPGTVHAQDSATRFVAEWVNYQSANLAVQSTFQIILNKDADPAKNTIDVVIDQCRAAPWVSIGIEDPLGPSGLNYYFDSTDVAGRSIRFNPNTPPAAAAVTMTTTEDTTVTKNVLAAGAVDADGDSITIDSIATPTAGTAVIVNGGKDIRYTPNADQNEVTIGGDDVFTYTVRDVFGATASGTVSVTVSAVDDPPVINITGDVETDEDQPLTVDDWLASVLPGPETATDEAGQSVTLTLTRTSGDPGLLVGGSPTLLPGPSPWTVGVATPPTDLVVTPEVDQNGQHQWKLDASDGASGTTRSFRITVNAVNDPPQFKIRDASPDLRELFVLEDSGTQDFTLDFGWADEILVAEHVATTASDEASQGYRFEITTDDPELFAVQPHIQPGADPARLRFRPAPDAVGTTSVQARIWDDGGTPADASDDASSPWQTGTIRILARNDAPVARHDHTEYLVGSGLILVDVIANDTTGPESGETLRLADPATFEGPGLGTVLRHSDTELSYRLDTADLGLLTGTFTADKDTDRVTRAGHGLVEGDLVRVDSRGGLPGGLVRNGLYFVRAETADTFQLSTSPDGPIVDITSAGTHQHTYRRAIRIGYEVVDDGTREDVDPSTKVVSTVPDENRSRAYLVIDIASLAGIGQPDVYSVFEDAVLDMDAARGVLRNDAAPQDVIRKVRLESPVSDGVIILRSDGSFRYTPESDFFGIDGFRYRIDLGPAGVTDPIDVEIVVGARNDAPLAIGDQYVMPPNETTIVTRDRGLLVNDKDADGDAMSASLATPPLHGSVIIAADGSFRYTPETGFTGLDSFFYHIRDSSSTGNRAEAIIRVRENEAPWADWTTDVPRTAVDRPVQFQDRSVDNDGNIVRWLWDMGNGDTQEDQHLTYRFGSPGEFRVKLTVWDEAGASSSLQKTFLVSREFNLEDGGTYAGGLPVADAGLNTTVLQGTRVQLGCRTSAASTCGDNNADTILGHHWIQVEGPPVRLSDADARYPSFQAPKVAPGEVVHLAFNLTIFDGQRMSLPSTVHVWVQESILKPLAHAGNDLAVRSGAMVNLRAGSTGFPDPDQVRFTWTQVTTSTAPDIGLGAFQGASLSLRMADVSTLLAHMPGMESIEYRFRVEATDGIIDAIPDEVIVRVNPTPATYSFSHTPGKGVDSLVVSFFPKQTDLSARGYEWDFGDGNRSQEMRPVHGYRQPGLYTVTWNVTLQDGRTQSFQKTIDVGGDLVMLQNVASEERAPVGALATLALVSAVAAVGIYMGVRWWQNRPDDVVSPDEE